MTASHNHFIKKTLMFEDLHLDPHKQFSDWLNEYRQNVVIDSVAMTFSTINKDGFPSSRIVFLRDIDTRGFVFFTNYDSNKGEEIRKNNKASVMFFWPVLERQVRVWGVVEKVEAELSDAYFKDRPKGSQAGAWISNQSKEIQNRDILEEMHQAFLRDVGDKLIPRPEFWGGYRLIPVMYEFWQGRESRLHDRFLYSKEGEKWDIKRLAP